MMIFDFFFYTVCRFLRKRLKRNKEDAKHSVLCILVVYIVWSIDVIAYIIGILKHNKISWIFIDKAFGSAVVIGIISYIVFRIRYYKIYDVENIEQKIMNLSDIKRFFYRWIIYLILISVPVLGFVTYRLYKFGYVL
ncbi:MAG: hypothetical protein LBD45_05080 [Bacteroidales bacterium]|jgi:cytochrome b561|nr:hypothetical protein [Bacteroidales bacterium]